MTERANIFEVGPRDGLQNESVILPVEQKVALIERLVAAGVTNIEIGSFVHPRWVPQMANTDEVARTIHKKDGVRYWALVPNSKGLERAVDAGLRHVAVFMSSSETHNQKNVNRSIDESLQNIKGTLRDAAPDKLEVRAYISTVFGCPYEGDVDFDRVLSIGDQLLEAGATQISLGDTTGMGQPLQVRDGSRRAVARWGTDRVALHLHDTRGLGQTNAFAGYLEGVRNFDSSVGGLGGCPYAPGAPGNLSTENLLGLMNAMHVQTGVDMPGIRETSAWLESAVGFTLKH
ncbi:MAG: hydroxymethylglutaryl-CoA lyase [bacterium]